MDRLIQMCGIQVLLDQLPKSSQQDVRIEFEQTYPEFNPSDYNICPLDILAGFISIIKKHGASVGMVSVEAPTHHGHPHGHGLR